MSKIFTIFQPGFDSDNFNKDVGLIPIIFQKHLNYKCNFLCQVINGSYEQLIKDNIQVIFINNDDTIVATLKNTDVLMLFGIYDYNLEMIKRYTQINSKGKIYLKLDMNIHWLRNIQMDDNLINLLNKCTLISVECRTLQKYIKEHWPVKVEYIPNGYYNFNDEEVSYEDKENTIITVGRLGSYQKGTEVLLEAFKLAAPHIKGWNLKLIGTIEESFKPYIDKFFSSNPELKDKVTFLGKITDRSLLEEEYKKAKIFCLTSRFEGFPNVFPECAVKGCYIISSDIDPAYDITGNKRYGDIFPIDNSEELAKILINRCINEDILKRVSHGIQRYIKKNFNWIKLCERIDYYLNVTLNFRQLIPHVLQRVSMESPTSVLDLCRYPIANVLLSEEELGYIKEDILIDRIEFNKVSTSFSYKHFNNNIYSENKIDFIDNLPNYDVIVLSHILEYLDKSEGFDLIDKLLEHTNKKLIVITPKISNGFYVSRYSYIDFYKYDFSCVTANVEDSEVFILSFYPNIKKSNDIDIKYNDFKSLQSFQFEKDKKLNIAYILPHKSVTGGLKVLIKQMKLLKSKEHTITGILQGDYKGSVFPDTHKIEIDREIIISHNDKIDDYLKDYDVIVTGFINDWINIENTKLPVILFEQGYETLFGEYKHCDYQVEKNNKLYFDEVYSSRQSLIVTVSSILSEILYHRYGRVCEVVPNGIDTSLYFPLTKDKSNIKKILLIGSPYLDFKGFDLALKVLKRLSNLNFKLEVTWICQERPYFEIPLNINYIINPDEELLTKTIRENHILLSTSWYESFALPPLEAMASGVAVVATDSGGIRTYGKDGYNCLLVPPGDIDGLLKVLVNLMLNNSKRNKLISNGLKTAAKFDIENTIDQWERMLYNISNFYKTDFNI